MGALVGLNQLKKIVVAAGTAVPLSSSSILTQAILIQADMDNTGSIFIGNSNIDSDGVEVLPGSSQEITGDMMGQGGDFEFDLSDIYIDAEVNDDFVRVLYIKRK